MFAAAILHARIELKRPKLLGLDLRKVRACRDDGKRLSFAVGGGRSTRHLPKLHSLGQRLSAG
jgi:hypothetical protein